MWVDTENLCDLAYIADQFGVSKQAVGNWFIRHKDELKEAVVDDWMGEGRIFLWSKVEAWGIETKRIYPVGA